MFHYCVSTKVVGDKNEIIDWSIDFFAMSTHLGLFYV